MHVDRAHDIVLDILLPGVGDFHGAIDSLSDPDGLIDEVGLETTAKPATNQVLVYGHLLWRDSERRGGSRLRTRHYLAANPYLTTGPGDVRRAVQRLHGRMSKKWQLVGRSEGLTVLHPGESVALALGDDSGLLAR